jgi:3-phosphoshikimate 1-carboxyvinyltransferase
MSSTLRIQAAKSVRGTITAPPDKSLTHRAYMFGAIASEESRVHRPLRGEDCESTLRCLNQLGLRHEWVSPTEIRLMPTAEWEFTKAPLDCGNSGTTMRLLSGLVASRPLDVTMVGDASLSKRPMRRIAEPLRLMGATFEGEHPPIRITGGDLHGIEYVSPVASAQVKSCLLLAGLRASGRTSVLEPSLSRDHTERMLLAMGAELTSETLADGRHLATVAGGNKPLSGFDFTVPGDISSVAFWISLAAATEGQIAIQGVGVNPARTGILDVVRAIGAAVELSNDRSELGEPVADLRIIGNTNRATFVIEGALVPRLIDEIPVLAVLATQCDGESIIRDARELRVKESDRIELMVQGLRAMGACVEATEDGMIITGPTPLRATNIAAHGDHRIAMAFAIAGLIAEGETVITGAESILTSYPEFSADLATLVSHE